MNKLKLLVYSTLLVFCTTIGSPAISRPKLQAVHKTDLNCLAQNIYHEARGEPIEGQIAVALVVTNRVISGLFQNTICGVVYAKEQFSWTQDSTKTIVDAKAFKVAKEIAAGVLDQSIHLPDFTALYFHNKTVRPQWRKTKLLVAQIGNHVFYK